MARRAGGPATAAADTGTTNHEEGDMLHIIWSIIVGFLAGLVARAVLPGANPMGFIATSGVGIVGSVIGGFIGNLVKKPEPGANFHAAGFLMSVVGAIVLLLALRLLR
jgi:uncharacterized membrane protein YeaQ/YmgE (transglycosylase-associated protein family)